MGARILVIDDDPKVRKMVASCLTGEGYSVDAAEGITAAQGLMESNDYEIMLIDKNMPGSNGNGEGGMDLLRYARAHGLSSEVIMMTGHATLDTAIEAMQLGAFDYMQKPFSLEDLLQKVKRLVEYRRFINPDYTFKLYKSIRGEVLKSIRNRSAMTDEEQERAIVSLNDEIDKVFKLVKGCEKVILIQRESLANIAGLAEQLRGDMDEADKEVDLVNEICRQSGNFL
jgi:DNA-binding NtrC family response regulator